MAGWWWVTSRLVVVVGILVIWPVPPCVDPQSPGGLTTPNVRDSLRLINILIRRPLGPMAVRRECRMLNTTEFERITGVINRAKRDTRIRPNVYDAFAYIHAHPDVNAGAHQGAGFLPFHRVLVFLFEKLLRMYDPTISMCYWDSTLEPANEMTASVSWTSSFFGNNQETVVTGFPARWLTPLGPLIRNGGTIGRPFTQEDIRQILDRNTLGEISFPGGNVDSNVEEKHNYVHTFVGGLMGQVETASYDPIFWFHHAYIDCIYEWFRQRQKERGLNPMRDWPAEYGDAAHSPFAAMRLGRLRQIDGANDFFPKNTFRCEDPPGDCVTDNECGVHMRCDPQTRRCVSDTMAVRPRNQAGEISNLRSLLGGFDGLASINSLLNSFPSRGFNQLFQTPSLGSFSLFGSNAGAGGSLLGGSSGGSGGLTSGITGDTGPRNSGLTSGGLVGSSGLAGSLTRGVSGNTPSSDNMAAALNAASAGVSPSSSSSSSSSSLSSSSSSLSSVRLPSNPSASAAQNLMSGLWNQV